MPKAFLSHSSVQKQFVTRIANELGSSTSIIDSRSFEEGMSNIEEIQNALDQTDIFVLFLSNEALNSKWVKDEILIAHENVKRNIIKRIYPIIIDETITHNDLRIPDWLKELNIKTVLRPGKVTRLINRRLKEVSWQLHPVLKEKELLFVGRTEQIKTLQERLYDFTKPTPFCIIASGIPKIGRKSFLKNALLNTHTLTRESHDLPTITISRRESIEDFIYKVYDLGNSPEQVFPDLLSTTLADKVTLASNLLADFQEASEILLIEDLGGIIQADRSICNWFKDILLNSQENSLESRITICVASRNRAFGHLANNIPQIFQIEIPELTISDRNGLLKRYSTINKLSINNENLIFFSNLLNGFPEQVHFCVDLIINESLAFAKANTYLIKNYQSEIFSQIISDIDTDINTKNILCLLADFEFISLELILTFINKDEIDLVQGIINKLVGWSIIEFLGVDKEYFRLNDGIKDYLQRAKYSLPESYKSKLKKHILEFVQTDQLVSEDISDFFFSMRGALLSNYNFKSSYLIPSHYLQTMIHLYEKEQDYLNVIVLADRVLQKADKLDYSIVREIKYWLCLSLARKKRERFKDEVQFFKGADYQFLFGFFNRIIGKSGFALNNFNKALEERPSFHRAKRELVKVYINLGMYDDAYDLAKSNYINDKNDPYHAHAYFDCLVRRKDATSHAKTLRDLIENLEKINTNKAKEMALLSQADYDYYINNDPEEALNTIRRFIYLYGLTYYVITKKFDIAEKERNVDLMLKVIDEVKNSHINYKFDENVINIMEAKCLSHQGRIDDALYIIDNLLDVPISYVIYLKEYVNKFTIK
ncbi:toll/interleukin-1 receptor domain-containing protein [Spirosoma linguale]|uniref:TIR protein n=1 Tax=Spirosoma linguale (strain ATCC 33905 / DSM 74 / LMG 10896 / Claus 1) TaxID=504472 RepID=D2QLE7_SPILD|nr:TIR protein [Spirosoma linguale DSM 74]